MYYYLCVVAVQYIASVSGEEGGEGGGEGGVEPVWEGCCYIGGE